MPLAFQLNGTTFLTSSALWLLEFLTWQLLEIMRGKSSSLELEQDHFDLCIEMNNFRDRFVFSGIIQTLDQFTLLQTQVESVESHMRHIFQCQHQQRINHGIPQSKAVFTSLSFQQSMNGLKIQNRQDEFIQAVHYHIISSISNV